MLTLEALERGASSDPERNVVVRARARDIFDELFGTVLARREPWTPAELGRASRALAARARRRRRVRARRPVPAEWAHLAAAADREALLRLLPARRLPADRRQAVLLQHDAARRPRRARAAGLLTRPTRSASCSLTLGDPRRCCRAARVRAAAGAGRAAPTRPPAVGLVFFAAIGLGFLLLEIALIQRFVLFLGFPTYALSVVLFALLVFTGARLAAVERALRQPRRALTLALGSPVP